MSKTKPKTAKPIDLTKLPDDAVHELFGRVKAEHEKRGFVDHNVRPPSAGSMAAVKLLTAARHSDGETAAKCEEALETATRLMPNLLPLIARIREYEEGHPRAVSYDGGGKTTIVWCEEHQRSVRDCHRTCIVHGQDLELDCRASHGQNCTRAWTCDGVPLLNRSDPAGDAAAAPDAARTDEQRLIGACVAFCGAATLWMDLAVKYTAKRPSGALRAETEDMNRQWCESCSRVENPVTKQPRQEQPDKGSKTNVGGRLAETMWLCGPCYRFVMLTQDDPEGPRIPTTDELEHFYDRGKFPNRHETRKGAA